MIHRSINFVEVEYSKMSHGRVDLSKEKLSLARGIFFALNKKRISWWIKTGDEHSYIFRSRDTNLIIILGHFDETRLK